MQIIKNFDFIIIFQLLSLFYNCYSMSKNKQSKMMKEMFIANILAMLIYIFNNDFKTTLIVIGTTIRCFLFMKKEKTNSNLIFWICFTLQLIIGICCYQNFSNLLTIFASLFACWASWFLNPQGIRWAFTFTDSLWIIYNFSTGLYIQVINCLVGMVSKLIFIFKYRKES